MILEKFFTQLGKLAYKHSKEFRDLMYEKLAKDYVDVLAKKVKDLRIEIEQLKLDALKTSVEVSVDKTPVKKKRKYTKRKKTETQA